MPESVIPLPPVVIAPVVPAGAALVGAVALMFSGPVLSLLDVSNNLATFAWIPLDGKPRTTSPGSHREPSTSRPRSTTPSPAGRPARARPRSRPRWRRTPRCCCPRPRGRPGTRPATSCPSSSPAAPRPARPGSACWSRRSPRRGRPAGCQIPLDDAYASQWHARVFQRDGHWYVEDLGSTNGTKVNNVRVSQHVLADGDEVVVSVRDDGAAMPPGRLDEAAADGRLGVAASILGRVRQLGGTAAVESAPGGGTEVEMRVPR